MGFRRRTRRRALLVGGMAGAAVAHNRGGQEAEQEQAPAEAYQEQVQPAQQAVPPPADPADQIEHLAQLHTSGALTDEEFASAKAKILES
jgi:Short C-terminal domain